MALRSITVDGLAWSIWDVRPQVVSREVSSKVRESLAGGWLAMQSDAEKRRIVPVPDGWEEWTDEQLTDVVRSAPRAYNGR